MSHLWNGRLEEVYFIPPFPRLKKMVLLEVLSCLFVHGYGKTILKTYSQFSLPDNSEDTSFSSLGLSSAEQRAFEDDQTIRQELSSARNHQKPRLFFKKPLNANWSAQNGPGNDIIRTIW
jgi:hypothetical protein